MPRIYNFIYQKLVKNDEDFVGIIAYSLYKKDKIAWITKYKTDNNQQDPPEDELRRYHEITSTDTHIARYRNDAERLLSSFCNNLLDAEKKTIENFYIENQGEVLIAALEKHEKKNPVRKFGHHILIHVVSAIALAILLYLILIVTWVEGQGSHNVIHHLLKLPHEIKDTIH